MGRIGALLFDLGDTVIVELDSPADIDTTEFDIIDGVREALETFRKRYKLAIVSNTFTWGDEEVTKALQRANLAKYFDAIVTSVSAGSSKPENDIFLKALRLLNTAPEESVMIGDRIDTDISGANMLGIISILFRWNDRYPAIIANEIDKPDYIISSMCELAELIAAIDGKSG